MSITSFDHFIETLEHVPAELQRNFQLMEELDRRNGNLVKRINECVREYRKSEQSDDRIILFKESMDLFEKARGFADDKVEIAMQTYDLVDKHIRRLESLSGAQGLIATATSSIATKHSNTSNTGENKQHKKNQSTQRSSKLACTGNKGGQNESDNGGLSGKDDGNCIGLLSEPLAVDMPLDPNEPKYCTCHQVSFGEMIACDNKDCPIEWFHFACVDLKSKPKGKWYCPECFNINKKGKHKPLKRPKVC